MRSLMIFIVTLGVMLLNLTTFVGAADIATVRQQLTSLDTEIASLDAQLKEINEKRTESQTAIEKYTKEVADNEQTGQHIKSLSQQLTSRKQQLANDQQNATELCSRKVSESEYRALKAECDQKSLAYQAHADEAQRQYQELAEKYTKYDTESKRLAIARDGLEKTQHDIQETQQRLHAEQEAAVQKFNDARQLLISLQSK
ncbi:MAG TPA: hypothetical protein VHY35_14210 [Stellaceae bacterium]|jgi:chromosome segregation ATPase|nr:hypothetical protein [Stellaceae bacterium]